LRKRPSDFKKRKTNRINQVYDVEFDKDLIEASFASQYGIRLRQEPDITYAEWSRLLSGLLPSTPLGQIIKIRAERDSKVIREYGDYEKSVREAWNAFKISNQTKEEQIASITDVQAMFKNLFSKGG